ncbi:unnamed protein product [Prorocentrum cordatum]|uniref:Uncharacterized protein n=1 Tax=Prorocentrum cordatum TaxID=2364126 RepID=A0ABN9SM74_9DINO|nr:unnamed protein product [Polarella glacialis]
MASPRGRRRVGAQLRCRGRARRLRPRQAARGSGAHRGHEEGAREEGEEGEEGEPGGNGTGKGQLPEQLQQGWDKPCLQFITGCLYSHDWCAPAVGKGITKLHSKRAPSSFLYF